MNAEDPLRIGHERIAEALDRVPPRRVHKRPTTARFPGAARLTATARTARDALGRSTAAVMGAAVRAWRLNLEIQERLYDEQHPWEREGPLRWQGRGSNARLVGCHLPTQPNGSPLHG